jgi:hypothetical protein
MKKVFKFIIASILFTTITVINSQEVRVIDNKGTKTIVRNNNVYTSATDPNIPTILAIENDVWIDTSTTPNTSYIWDDTSWVNTNEQHIGTTGSVFFAGTDGKPSEQNDELFYDISNKRVGIGTNSPTNKLEVSGATGTQGLLNSNGSVTEPAYRFKNDTDTGIFRPNLVDEMGIVAGGIEAIHIEEDSNKTLVTIKNTLALDGELLDINDSVGTIGQILSSTVTGTEWIDQSTPSLMVTKETIGYVFAAAHTLGNGTNSFNINCSVNRTATGRYTVTFTTAHPNGANYDITFGAQVDGNRDSRIVSVVQGTQTANGFDLILVTGDNGTTADTYVDEVWYFNTSATKEVVTDVTLTTTSTPTGSAVTPIGVLDTANRFNIYNYGDVSSFALDFANTANSATDYEILISNAPYSTIPNISAGNYTLTSSANGNGTYNHLITSTAPIGGNNSNITITGSQPSPSGTNNGGQPNAPITITFYTR